MKKETNLEDVDSYFGMIRFRPREGRMSDLIALVSAYYSRWIVIEDSEKHIVSFYLPFDKKSIAHLLIFAGQLEFLRPFGIDFRLRKLPWWRNRFSSTRILSGHIQ